MTIRAPNSYGEAMPKPFRAMKAIIFLLALLTLWSCGDGVETIHILTDRKELASAVEIFDAADDKVIITIRHVPVINTEMIETEKPDLVIGAHLSSPEIVDLLRPTEFEFPVYEALVGPADSRGRSYLTPLSFELPLIMGKETVLSELPDPMVVRPGELREASAPFSAVNDGGRLIRLGFSPNWNPRSFTDLLAVRYPTAFVTGMDHFDNATLAVIVEEARNWILETAGDMKSDTDFNKRYRYVPDEYLILEGRILFARTSFKNWASLPDITANQLNLRYFSGPRTIPVIAVISAGIPSKSGSPDTSSRFIHWLMLPETQSRLMARWERDGITVFGFLGGLSSLPEVNESILIRHYPVIKGMIPEGHYLSVPESLSHRWPRIRDEVIAPWFQSVVSDTGNIMSLSEAYRKWDLSSLAEAE